MVAHVICDGFTHLRMQVAERYGEAMTCMAALLTAMHTSASALAKALEKERAAGAKKVC